MLFDGALTSVPFVAGTDIFFILRHEYKISAVSDEHAWHKSCGEKLQEIKKLLICNSVCP